VENINWGKQYKGKEIRWFRVANLKMVYGGLVTYSSERREKEVGQNREMERKKEKPCWNTQKTKRKK
jgi:hypothetical protein